MRILKKITKIAVCAALTVSSILSLHVYATTSTRTIDNDSIATGYGNENTGFSYISGVSSLINSDGRYSNSSSSSNLYKWTYPSLSSGSTTQYATIQIGAYLDYSSWTDTAASYWAQYYYNISKKIGTINQNKAPSGYSYIEAADIHTADASGGHYSSFAYVKPSGNSNQITGADQIKVTLSY